jgi:hypothetical protein
MEAGEDWSKGGGAPPVRTLWLRTGMGDGWGWRLTNELESLCTKVMQTKYHSHGDILKACP